MFRLNFHNDKQLIALNETKWYPTSKQRHLSN